ncbi:hypothetical protein M0811_01690 [Anaeramoeba ignava]|uniref:Uncharacterized protein n=1 Tax=Anaeramoeba ignava TaxID=1746090 RepID=A0A9Q0LF36_ANAIG|nr:hypothetical protein M0811_01690 [Anaeramoeba ignava]
MIFDFKDPEFKLKRSKNRKAIQIVVPAYSLVFSLQNENEQEDFLKELQNSRSLLKVEISKCSNPKLEKTTTLIDYIDSYMVFTTENFEVYKFKIHPNSKLKKSQKSPLIQIELENNGIWVLKFTNFEQIQKFVAKLHEGGAYRNV